MRLGKKWRIGVFVGALAGSVGLVTAAAGATGAYFNDTQGGTVTGTVGSVKVTTSGGSGGNGLDFDFANMLPGQFQTSTVQYTNTGTGSEDIYLVFNNAQALHSVNNLGTYGGAKIGSNGSTVFSSTNLNDGEQADLSPIPANSSHCSSAQGAQVPLSQTGCRPIPNVIKLAANVPPQNGGEIVTFRYAYGPDQVVTHRVFSDAGGAIRTKDDANPTKDPWTLRRAQVVGTPAAIVPDGGYALVYLSQPTGDASVATFALMIWLLWDLCFRTGTAEPGRARPARARHAASRAGPWRPRSETPGRVLSPAAARGRRAGGRAAGRGPRSPRPAVR